jgi:hypothetical protein
MPYRHQFKSRLGGLGLKDWYKLLIIKSLTATISGKWIGLLSIFVPFKLCSFVPVPSWPMWLILEVMATNAYFSTILAFGCIK